jgi:hypothetical protein
VRRRAGRGASRGRPCPDTARPSVASAGHVMCVQRNSPSTRRAGAPPSTRGVPQPQALNTSPARGAVRETRKIEGGMRKAPHLGEGRLLEVPRRRLPAQRHLDPRPAPVRPHALRPRRRPAAAECALVPLPRGQAELACPARAGRGSGSPGEAPSRGGCAGLQAARRPRNFRVVPVSHPGGRGRSPGEAASAPLVPPPPSSIITTAPPPAPPIAPLDLNRTLRLRPTGPPSGPTMGRPRCRLARPPSRPPS